MKQILACMLLLLNVGSYAQRTPQYKVLNQEQFEKDTTIQKDNLEYLLSKGGCPADLKEVKDYLLTMPYVIDENNPKIDRLVSDPSFRKLIRADFTKTVLGMDNTSKLNRYASLDLSDKPSFDFTPLVWRDDIKKKTFQNMASVNISGKLNSSGFLEFKDVRDLTLKVNYVFLLNLTNYKPTDDPDQLRDPLYCDMKPGIESLILKYQKKFQEVCEGNCGPRIKRMEIVNAFIDEFTDLEVKVSEKYWKSKHYYWVSVNGGLKRDKVQFVTQSDLAQKKYLVNSETIVTPEITGAFNAFHIYKSGASILYSLAAGIKQKHRLSEVYTPENFQPNTKINDSLMRVKDQESVFVTDFSEISKKAKLDWNVRLVCLSPNLTEERNQQIGIAFSYSNRGLVSSDDKASLSRIELGLVFPFLKEDGESKLNLELFHRWDTYKYFSHNDERTFGLRFNIPLSN